MDEWFDHLVREVIWKGIEDAAGSLAGEAASAIEEKLAGLQPGEELSSSPLVGVVAKDNQSVTLLIRGRFNLFDGAAAPFMRIQAAVSKKVDSNLDPPITIKRWDTVVGDLQIKKEGAFTAELGFGYDAGTWLGRGALKLIPAKFGLDLLLGGLDEDGLAFAIDVDLPSPIPLGSSGAVLTGVGGEFAYNFFPRLNQGLPKKPEGTPWDATDYVKWAREKELDRWVAAAKTAKPPDTPPVGPDKTAAGIGIRAAFGDLPTLGWMMSLEPIGLAVITPGPIFVLGGEGKLLNSDSIQTEGYVAVDIDSESMALGLAVHAVEKWEKFKLLDAKGTLDAFFSLARPSDWYVRFGTNTSPIKAKVFEELDADAFLMLGHGAVPHPTPPPNDGVFLGIGLSYGGEWKWWIIEVVAKIGARVAVGIGWNPLVLGGAFTIFGELGLKVWEIGLKIALGADLIGVVAQPTKLTGDVRYKFDLPWPIPDIKGTLPYTIGDEAGPPDLESPLLLGSA